MKNKIIISVAASVLVSAAFCADTACAATKTKKTTPQATQLSTRTTVLEKQIQYLKEQIDELRAQKKQSDELGSLAEIYAHGPAVVTSPSLGVRRSADNALDLIVNLSSINEDLTTLQIRQKMDNYAKEHNLVLPERPIIALSGGVEGQISYDKSYTEKKTGDINFSKAELDIIGEASPWATATMIFSYDNDQDAYYGPRVNNSRLQLKRGYLTFGQLDKFPVYFTIGQAYEPFGSYLNYMVTTPMTQLLGRIKQRTAILGYNQFGVYGQLYAYNPETKVPGNVELDKCGGGNIGYKYGNDNFSMDVGAGYTGNIAESEGMQSSVLKHQSTDSTDNRETLVKRVPAVNGHARFSLNPVTILGEYVGATKAFDVNNMMFNNQGAKPQAMDLEAVVDFKIANKPNTFSIGYGRTWQALALGLPKHDYFAAYSVSLFKDTIESIEYRRNINYGWGDVAKGNTMNTNNDNVKGRIGNTVTAQFGVYF